MPDLGNKEPTIMVQKAANLQVTDPNSDDSPVSGEDDEDLFDNDRCFVMDLSVQTMIDSAILR